MINRTLGCVGPTCSHTRRLGVGAYLAVLAVASVLCPTAPAGEIVTAEGQRQSGTLTMPDADHVIVTPEDGAAQTFSLIDLERVLLRPDLSPGEADLLLIDNDGRHGPTTVSQSVKLKAGLHRITLAYWQSVGGRDLYFEYSGPNVPRTEVPGTIMRNVKNETDPPASLGYDAEGFRLPENPEDTRPRLRYRFFTGDPDAGWGAMDVFGQLEEKRSGTTDRVSLRVADQDQHFGVLYYGYLQIETDGEYTFHLKSDDGSRLWLGADPPLLAAAGVGGSSTEQRPWTVRLRDPGTGGEAGRLGGRVTAWDAEAMTVGMPLGDASLSLTIPRDHIAMVLPRGGELSPADRAGETAQSDHAYVRREDDNSVRRVSGRVLAVEGDNLVFEYRGEARKIALERLAGLVLAAPPDAVGSRFAFSQRLDLLTGHVLPGKWRALTDGQVVFDTAWGQAIEAPAALVAQVRMIGGRLIYLADAEPDDVSIVPYFDRVIPLRRNATIGGGTLELFNGRRYERGFAVHGQTELRFDLAGGFERFIAEAGLAKPGGEAGNVDVRVLGDGKVLFERTGFTAADAPVTIDLDVTGVKQLTLATGFGGGQDVGDRVIWADPRLIRQSTTEATP